MEKPRVSLLIIGDELTTGAISDTNGSFLARELTCVGFEILRFAVVRDEKQAIGEELARAAHDSALVITTGGLGPTSDDLTREAIAEFAGVQLIEDSASQKRLEERYAQRALPLNPVSLRQCVFPAGAEVVPNPVGTADAFLVRVGALRVVALPGIVAEVRALADKLFPLLEQEFPNRQAPHSKVLKFFGLSESHIGSCIEGAALPAVVQVGYRPVFPEVWVKLSGSDARELEAAGERVRAAVGTEFCISTKLEESLPDTVGQLLEERGMTIGVAESCTGGLVASAIVSRPGASTYFLGSVVAYADLAKENYLSLPHDLLRGQGAVSVAVARQMAYAVKHNLGSDIGIAITGIAGPGGGSEEKPVGTVYLAIQQGQSGEVVHWWLPFERNRFREYAAALALDLVRRSLLGYRLQWERR